MPWLTIYELQEKKQAIAQNYWDSSRRAIESQFEFVASQIARVKKVLDKKRYELLEGEIDELMKEIAELADVLGLEIEELPKHLPFYTLPVKRLLIEKSASLFLCVSVWDKSCVKCEIVKKGDKQDSVVKVGRARKVST